MSFSKDKKRMLKAAGMAAVLSRPLPEDTGGRGAEEEEMGVAPHAFRSQRGVSGVQSLLGAGLGPPQLWAAYTHQGLEEHPFGRGQGEGSLRRGRQGWGTVGTGGRKAGFSEGARTHPSHWISEPWSSHC